MIDLTIEELILWMISVPIVMVGLFTLISGFRRRASLRAARRHIVSCRVCGHLYMDRSHELSPLCPECGRANGRGRSRRLG